MPAETAPEPRLLRAAALGARAQGETTRVARMHEEEAARQRLGSRGTTLQIYNPTAGMSCREGAGEQECSVCYIGISKRFCDWKYRCNKQGNWNRYKSDAKRAAVFALNNHHYVMKAL